MQKRRMKSLYKDNNLGVNEDLSDVLDDDLMELFDDLIIKKKNIVSKKSNLKSKSRFKIGDQVNVNNTFGTIIYGPYKSSNNKDTYEIETEENQIITAEDNGDNITPYVPVIEEQEDDIF
jgi:hypothetical protein